MIVIKSLLVSVFISLSIMASIGLYNPLHQFIFTTFLPADTLANERNYLVAYFRGQSALDSSKFSPSELSHIADIKEVIQRSQSAYGYLLIIFILWQLAEWKRSKPEIRWLQWQRQLKFSSLLWPPLALLLVASFAPLFILFHQIFFPNGNWQFDPATDLIIQLYPPQFFFYFLIVWTVATEVALLVGFYLIKVIKKSRSSL